MSCRHPTGLRLPRRIAVGMRMLLVLSLALLAPMAPAAAGGQGAHAGHTMFAPMHESPQADTNQGGADGGWLTHLACAVVCAGAPDPTDAAAPLDAPHAAAAPRLWPRFAAPPGMALAPLRRPPKLPTA